MPLDLRRHHEAAAEGTPLSRPVLLVALEGEQTWSDLRRDEDTPTSVVQLRPMLGQHEVDILW